MPPRINRAAVTLETGEALRDLAKRLAKIHEYSGAAREKELRSIELSLSPLSARLTQVINNCRAAGGSYPNYPAVRKAIQEGGDKVYELRGQLEQTRANFSATEDPLTINNFVASLARIGQDLKLVQFAPPIAQETETVK